jgi:hypothetical protein
MTATSHPKRVFMRLASMESLGFFDSPTRSWSTPTPESVAGPALVSDETETTGLITLPVGKHSRHAEPTGELVQDIWDSTELNAPSLADWAPQAFAEKHMRARRFRWPMVALLIVLAVSVAGAAWWLYREPGNSAATALDQVRVEAEGLSATIAQVLPLVDDLDADRLPEANRDASVFFEMGEQARAMFAASADLPAADAIDRTAAAEAAGLIIDASRRLMDATAYRTALEPALTLPLLETDPELTDLTTATDAFTEWRVGFESMVASLPLDVADQAAAALELVGSELEAIQIGYLDALRTGNRTMAVEALGNLRADLLTVRQAMLADITDLSVAVSGQIGEAETELDRLLG